MTRVKGLRPENNREVLVALHKRLMGPPRNGKAEEFAKKIGLNPAYLCRVRHGDRELTQRIAMELGYVLRWVKLAKEENVNEAE